MCGGEEKRMGWEEKERKNRKKNEDLGGAKEERRRDVPVCSDFRDFSLLIWGFFIKY
jgi:hypothetical protein